MRRVRYIFVMAERIVTFFSVSHFFGDRLATLAADDESTRRHFRSFDLYLRLRSHLRSVVDFHEIHFRTELNTETDVLETVGADCTMVVEAEMLHDMEIFAFAFIGTVVDSSIGSFHAASRTGEAEEMVDVTGSTP